MSAGIQHEKLASFTNHDAHARQGDEECEGENRQNRSHDDCLLSHQNKGKGRSVTYNGQRKSNDCGNKDTEKHLKDMRSYD